MRVLHVMECTIGGTRRHLVEVALAQRALGLDVHVAASSLRQPDFELELVQLERAGIGVRRVPMVRELRPLTDHRHAHELQRILLELRPQIVHTHSSKAGALGRWASLRTGIGQRVHTPHTFAFLFEAMFPAWKRALFRRVETYLGARTARIVAVSADEAATIERARVVSPRIVRVVPNGIDPAPYRAARPLARRELGFDQGRPLVLVAGLFNLAKGQDLALAALCEPGLEQVQLALAGNGGERAALERQCARLGLKERVRFLGFRRDVPALLASADVLLLPSRWEGLPYIVLEAMAAGRAVVATPVDGARELIRASGAGRLASAIDAPAIAAALREVLELDPRARAELGARGQAAVLEHYTVRRMAEGLIAVYHECG